jgi:hypothetical protein
MYHPFFLEGILPANLRVLGVFCEKAFDGRKNLVLYLDT